MTKNLNRPFLFLICFIFARVLLKRCPVFACFFVKITSFEGFSALRDSPRTGVTDLGLSGLGVARCRTSLQVTTPLSCVLSWRTVVS